MSDRIPPISERSTSNKPEIDRRLFEALQAAGRSALGMPSSVDTFNDLLERHGLALVLR